MNDYERRYGVTQDVIVSAITGEDLAANILSSQIKEQRVDNNLIIGLSQELGGM